MLTDLTIRMVTVAMFLSHGEQGIMFRIYRDSPVVIPKDTLVSMCIYPGDMGVAFNSIREVRVLSHYLQPDISLLEIEMSPSVFEVPSDIYKQIRKFLSDGSYEDLDLCIDPDWRAYDPAGMDDFGEMMLDEAMDLGNSLCKGPWKSVTTAG